MKDGRTHLAYKAENVVDLDTDLILAAVVYTADNPDTNTLVDSVMHAQTHINEANIEAQIEEVAADKGYHAAHTLELADALSLRTYKPGQRPPPATHEQRTGGTHVRPHVHHGRRATHVAPRAGEGEEAVADAGRGPQPGLDRARVVRNGHGTHVARRRGPCPARLYRLPYHVKSYSTRCQPLRTSSATQPKKQPVRSRHINRLNSPVVQRPASAQFMLV